VASTWDIERWLSRMLAFVEHEGGVVAVPHDAEHWAERFIARETVQGTLRARDEVRQAVHYLRVVL
jgi:hypothetical protein